MSAGYSGNLIRAANERAQSRQNQGQPGAAGGNGGEGRALDVTAEMFRDLAGGVMNLPHLAVQRQNAYMAGMASAFGPDNNYGMSLVGEAGSSAQEAADAAAKGWSQMGKANGALGKADATFNMLIGIEQALSGPFSLIKFPAMPAVRVLDFALGLPHGHVHPPTNGTPLPSIGPVIPLPWLSGAEKTTINGRPAARCGDLGIGLWCGGYFPMYEIMLGSSSVWIEGWRAARVGVDLTFHCLMSRLPGPKDSPTVGVPLGFMISASDNVIIGGFPLPSLLSLLMGLGFKLITKGLGKLVKAARNAAKRPAREAGEEAGERAGKEAGERAGKEAPRLPKGSKVNQEGSCPGGHPVDIASGRVYNAQTDFGLAGRIPIEFTRIYDSSAIDYEGPLGWGWMHPYDIHLWVDDIQEMVILRNEEVLPIGFNLIAIGEKDFNPLEKQWLERLDDKVYVVRNQDGDRYKFAPIKPHDSALSGKSEAAALRLIEIEDRNGNQIDLSYEGGRLSSLKDGAGTLLNFSYIILESGADRLTGVSLALDEKSTRTARLVNFTYDDEGHLINATDRGLVPWRYTYDDHLLIRETNRNGLSFHFAYRGKGRDARCVHTWGDGGIYERYLDYDPEARRTVVEDSLGAKTTYYFNELDLPVKIIDPLGGENQYKYGSKGELLSETDEIERTAKYKYNDYGDCISIMHPDGTIRRFEYTGDSLLQKLIDEAEAEFQHEYDQRGNIIATIDALGNRHEYSYNEFGDLEKAVDPLGGETKFKWNERGQITELATPLGAATSYGYDERGRLVWISDPLGHTTRYAYDALDRLVQVERSDGTKHRYEYDPEGNLTNFLDANGAEIRFRYVDYNKLAERINALGYTQRFVYDTEANLVEVRNERGETYRFTYDALDRVIREVGIDGLSFENDYDPAGQLVARTDPAGLVTRFSHNLHGQVIERVRPDGTSINFSYDSLGRLTGAIAPGGELEFNYDALGRLIAESQNGQVIEHEYDALGCRIKRHSPSGRTVEFIYDADSRLDCLQTPRGSIEFEYDKAGRIAKWRMPGELEESFYYDRCGRLIEQSLHNPTHTLFLRGYKYDSEGNLIELNDSKKGTSCFAYDPVERLREVRQPERKVEQFVYDSTGNLLRRGEREFRYGQPDRLTQMDDTKLIYDEVGNLIEKRCAGSVIHYSYDPDNQLIAVESKQGGRIEFTYDALGRRTTKKTKDGETGFLWDGDVLLAEERGGRSSEYIFEPDGYSPLCRFDGESFEIYHNDHLGTPQELTNERGQVVWSASYDVYGSIHCLHVDKVESNIRFQGQYQDSELGLCYNLYRYFDNWSGRYINKDPIGLLGGLNLYRYTPNPVNWIDPLGLETTDSKPWDSGREFYRNQYRLITRADFKNGEGLADDFERPDGTVFKAHPNKHNMSTSNQLDILNNWEKSFTGTNANGRQVDIYWKDESVVITQRGAKHKRITAYGKRADRGRGDPVPHERWSDRKRWKKIGDPLESGGRAFADEVYKRFNRNRQRKGSY
jgi:RHS repeat-associated protein